MYTLQLLTTTGSAVIATLHDASVRSWSHRLNGPGRLVYRVPVESESAKDAFLRPLLNVRLLRRTQDGTNEDADEWTGYIEAYKRISDAEIEVYCAGNLQIYRSRYCAADESFTGQGSTEAHGLLADTNANDGDTGIVAGTGGVTSSRAVVVSGRKDVLSVWEELAQAHGAEFFIDTSRRFHFVPRMGEDKTGSAFTALVYHTDEPGSTVLSFAEGADGRPLRNKIVGLNRDGTLTSTKQDPDSQATYGVLVEVKVFEEANDQTTLDALTQTHLNQVRQPIPEFEARPALAERRTDIVTGGLTTEGLQYGTFGPGDTVRCEIVTTTRSLTADKRIVEVLVDVTDDGEEGVSYTLGDEGVFVTGNSLASREIEDVRLRVLQLEQNQGSGGGGGGGGSDAVFVDRETPSGSVNGGNDTFTLADTPVAGSEHVWLNGGLHDDSGDYAITGDEIVFAVPPPTGSILRVSYRTDNGTIDFADRETPAGSVNDVNTAFTLANTPEAGSEMVYLNGLLMAGGGVDYSISGPDVTFVTAPPSGSVLLVSYRF